MYNIAIISSQYPSQTNHYAHTFVHQRSTFLRSHGWSVTVFVPGAVSSEYIFDDITVKVMPSYFISQCIKDFDCVYFHLLHMKKPSKCLSGYPIYREALKIGIPIALYIHGSEVQKISSRLFEKEKTILGFFKYIYKDFYYIPLVSKFYRDLFKRGNYFIAMPSKWMREEAELNLGVKIESFSIIPNGIDTKIFRSDDSNKHSNRLLSIRQMTSPKYAIDVSIEMMKYLPGYVLDLYGKGPMLNSYKEMAKNLNVEKRINFIEQLIPNSKMPSVMAKYKYFICPTRMDAQGVSMCEAMSVGCVPVTNNNTAIPEFVQHEFNGICVDSAKEMADSIKNLSRNSCLLESLSRNAKSEMQKIDINKTLSKELALIESLILKGN